MPTPPPKTLFRVFDGIRYVMITAVEGPACFKRCLFWKKNTALENLLARETCQFSLLFMHKCGHFLSGYKALILL